MPDRLARTTVMIGGDYCRMMARYNAWQNSQLIAFLDVLDGDELTRDRGAFFGSILGTATHLLWGDGMWIARFDGGVAPDVAIADSGAVHGGWAEWLSARKAMDARILRWADSLRDNQLGGDLTWYSGAMGRELSKPLALCVVQLFNHQTHHRGQIHAMLTATGSPAPVSDLFFMPEDA